MFGTMGFSELIIILAIVLIIFGAGRLPQLGEGLGKALKGFKKEVREAEPPVDPNAVQEARSPAAASQEAPAAAESQAAVARSAPAQPAPYQPGPELTPGTTAALMASAAPQAYQPKATGTVARVDTQPPVAPDSSRPPTMEERTQAPSPALRASYPALPPTARPAPVAGKRPSAVVNKDAVARVQAQQAAQRQKAAQSQGGLSTQDMQGLGESLGDALRTFRQAAADVRSSIDPEVHTLRNEVDSAQKELEQTIESAKSMPAVEDEPQKSS